MDHLPPEPPASSDDAGKKGMDRRTLLRAGAAAAPVISTLYSGPVSASGSIACTVASSFVSVATFASRNPGATTMQCSSLNASYWHAQSKNLLTSTGARPAWATQTVRAYLGRSSSTLPGIDAVSADSYQIWQVMGLGPDVATSGEVGVLQHILGLALSIDFGSGAVNMGSTFNTPYLKQVWQNYKSNGRYLLAASSVDWSEAQLITWLRMLQYPIPTPRA
jgi:hypothetical protein